MRGITTCLALAGVTAAVLFVSHFFRVLQHRHCISQLHSHPSPHLSLSSFILILIFDFDLDRREEEK
jgi:hypothetical protein